MVSAVDLAKRALVTLLKLLAATYGCVLEVTRESSANEGKSAYRQLPVWFADVEKLHVAKTAPQYVG